jgi:hypothetical protein
VLINEMIQQLKFALKYFFGGVGQVGEVAVTRVDSAIDGSN